MEYVQNGSIALAGTERSDCIGMKQNRKEGLDDLQLIDRVKRGDREAFMVLTELYQRSVFLTAFSFFRNREDALDIVQETFLRLYQKIHLFQKDRNFKNWLLQIAKNICIDHYRKNTKRDLSMERNHSIEEMNIPGGIKEGNNQDAPMREAINSCLNKLTEKQRCIFMLKHYNDLEYREIAEIMDVALGTVKSLHFKAVRNLRVLMSPYVGRTT